MNHDIKETPKAPHSARYFGPWRDFWWNEDYLELTSKRLNFQNIKNVLDVGCGVGHWGRALARFLPKNANITGVDREDTWVKNATENAEQEKSWTNFQYVCGSAESLPFKDNLFDMVTCQTLLIHVPDIKKVILEMKRVLRPGGLLLLSEPNNLTQNLTLSSLDENLNIEMLTQKIEFVLRCQIGKANLKKGFNSAGDHIPKQVVEAGFDDLQIFTNDKTTPLTPPYESKEQQIFASQVIEWCQEDSFIWPKAEAQEYYLAGGGSLEEFKIVWPNLLKHNFELANAIKNKTYWGTHACTHYLISGRKNL